MNHAPETWSKTKTMPKAIEMVSKASKILIPCVEELMSCVNSAINGRKDDMDSAFAHLEQLEREGDGLRRVIINELAQGNLPVDERRSFMRLTRQVDWVADWCLEAGRLVSQFPIEQMSEEIGPTTLEMCKAVRDCVSETQRCVDLLTAKKVQEAFEAANSVESLEEKVDDLYRKTRDHLSKLSAPEYTVGSVILLAKFFGAIENIADACENVCDQARVIAVSVGT